VETNLKIQRAEIALENYYDLLMLDLYKSKKSKKSIQQKVTETAKGTREIYAQYQSFKIGRIAHTIFVLEQELKKDYESMLVCCQEAIRYFEAKKNSVSKEIISFFYRSMMTACIPLKNFSEGEKHAKKSLSTVIEGSLDWYRTLDQYYILSLHTKNYKKANDIFEKACKFYRFNHIPILNQEIWRVYSAYQEYLRHQGLIEKTEIKPFRINKFMNDVPNYSKDKKGINISIIIIQVLFLIAQKKETQVINRVDSLRVYVHTHLRNDDSFRSNCFIKMLVKMIQANFHKEGTIRKTKDLYEKLVASPLISSNGRNQYIEIIPYEHLWEMNLSYLHNRAY
jgi:tetratricopeptide (TPR) repeat protein